jgi:hypothetical protein
MVSVLLLTEDHGKDAHEVLCALAEKMLRRLEPYYDERKVGFKRPTDYTSDVMAGHAWKERRGHVKQTDLRQIILTKLLRREQEGFVFVHMDGDMPWAQSRDGALHSHWDQFERLILTGVRHGLKQLGEGAREERLCLVSPYYHIEAWLYQNTDALERIYERSYKGKSADLETLREWQGDPALLDEVINPKDKMAIGSRENLTLATAGFPAEKVYGIGKSFTHTVKRMQACSALRAALQLACYT